MSWRQPTEDDQRALDRCRAMFEAHLREPTQASLEALRLSYEAVAVEVRMFLGDQDVKDVPIRMVLYGEAEIERWSHRIVGRRDGVSPLPDIRFRHPLDELRRPQP